MAIPVFTVTVGKRDQAEMRAAYISRLGHLASRTALEELEWTSSGNMPGWATKDPILFWRAADRFERQGGTTFRQFLASLPREITKAQRQELVEDFVASELGSVHPFQLAIHNPLASDGRAQPHLHLMFSERLQDGIDRDPEIFFKRFNRKDPGQGGCRKLYGSSDGKTLTSAERSRELKALRMRWQLHVNRHLAKAKRLERISLLSYFDQGSSKIAEPKLSVADWESGGKERILLGRALALESDAVLATEPLQDEHSTMAMLAESATYAKEEDEHLEEVDDLEQYVRDGRR